MNDEIRSKLNTILVSGEIEENIDFLLENIPEIKPMIGFDQNHPCHFLDVWGHTVCAFHNLDSFDDIEVDMATLLHDIGKPFSYQDAENGRIRHFKGHPEVSFKMAGTILKRLGYDEKFMTDVCYLVRFHDDIIDPTALDNTIELVKKRLQVQYADAKAHSLIIVDKRLRELDKIKEQLSRI